MMKRVFFILPLVAVACGESEPPTSNPGEVPVVRPTSVETVDLGLTTQALPAELVNDATLSVAQLGAVTVVGGTSGLYQLGADTLSQIGTEAVTAIVAYEGVLLVANATGLQVFDSGLTRSPINDTLGTATITDLRTRGAQLWIATDMGLFIFENDNVTELDMGTNIASISTFAGATHVVARLRTGGFVGYRLENDTWIRRELTPEGMMQRLVAGANARLFSTQVGALLERVPVSDQVVWRASATTTDGSGDTGVEGLVADPSSGAVWVISDTELSRIDVSLERVSKVTRPAGLGAVIKAVVTLDGALWLSDGQNLNRVGSDGPPLSFATDVMPLHVEHCQECHKPFGAAPMSLETYDDWTDWIDRSIIRLEEGTMPPAGPLTPANIDIVRRWRADGLRP